MNKKMDLLELEVEAIGSQGVSIARKDGKVYFVKGAVPGDKVLAGVVRKRKKYSECKLMELIVASPLRTEPKCSYSGICGGCSWQHLQYQEQLKWKKRQVEDAFQRIGKIQVETIEETLASPDIFHYRNKMEFSFGASRWLTQEEIQSGADIQNKDFALGLHIPGRFDKVLDISECHIQNPLGNDVLNAIRSKSLEFGLTAYNSRTNQGFLRNIIIRSAEKFNELMIILITNSICEKKEEEFINWYDNDFAWSDSQFSVVGRSVNSTRSPVASEPPVIVKGKDYITEEILGIDFCISPFSFFQTNSKQLNNFISEIIGRAELDSNSIIWDLYCGTGSITLPAAGKCKKIYGIELFEATVEDAKTNAYNNGISNAEFICADLNQKAALELLGALPKPDVIIADPPRAGIHRKTLDVMMDIEPKRIVYVSCNPETQARDCSVLCEKYSVKSLRPVDMFPHTFHVESIAVLELNE